MLYLLLFSNRGEVLECKFYLVVKLKYGFVEIAIEHPFHFGSHIKRGASAAAISLYFAIIDVLFIYCPIVRVG